MKAYVGVEKLLHSFLTSAQDGGESPTSRPGRFYSDEITQVPIEQEAGWAPQLVQTFWRKSLLPLHGFELPGSSA
jgi:hypothetical protein